MSLQLVGLNYKTAPLELREKLAFKEENRAANLKNLTDGAIVREALILSTCNRVEILLEGEPETTFARAIEFIAANSGVAPENFAEHLYHYSDEGAVRHLFRVAASLDSMIVGEGQILGQVRAAYETAAKAGTAKRKIHKLLHHAFRAAKRVRGETRIGGSAISVSSAAVEKARKIFGTLANKTVLLLGAGEMAELAAKHLVNKGANRILICNRTLEKAVELASEIGGEVVEFEMLQCVLPQADVILCSTAAPDFLITPEIVRASQNRRQNRPALLIDISVPRNVAPEVARIENVFLYDVDDLRSVAAANSEAHEREIRLAERIVKEEAAAFWEFLPVLDKGEILGLLQQQIARTTRRQFELQRAQLGDLTAEQEIAVERLVRSTVNKITQPIFYSLRRAQETGATEFAEILLTMMGEAGEAEAK